MTVHIFATVTVWKIRRKKSRKSRKNEKEMYVEIRRKPSDIFNFILAYSDASKLH